MLRVLSLVFICRNSSAMFYDPLSIGNEEENFFPTDKAFYASMTTGNGHRTMNYGDENQA